MRPATLASPAVLAMTPDFRKRLLRTPPAQFAPRAFPISRARALVLEPETTAVGEVADVAEESPTSSPVRRPEPQLAADPYYEAAVMTAPKSALSKRGTPRPVKNISFALTPQVQEFEKVGIPPSTSPTSPDEASPMTLDTFTPVALRFDDAPAPAPAPAPVSASTPSLSPGASQPLFLQSPPVGYSTPLTAPPPLTDVRSPTTPEQIQQVRAHG